MKRQTRIFVRRQANWFKRNDPAIHWFPVAPGVEGEIVMKISKSIDKNYV
jgi:tRNA dimethylallyltransferase